MMVETKKHLHVACAIIEHDGMILAAQRSATMTLPLKWEFPGGKMEPGESAEACLERELMEEMGIRIQPGRALASCTHAHTLFTVTLYPFICTITSGKIVLHEHAAIVWMRPHDLLNLDWAEADLPVIRSYLLGQHQPLTIQPQVLT